jgi:hypothetical protein
MDSKYFERLAPSGSPDPWLAVIAPGREDYVIQIASSEQAVDMTRLKKEWIIWIDSGDEIVAVKDAPTLRVHYCGGLYCDGDLQASLAHLAARRNWFLRYKQILDPHLANPLTTLVQFYERRPLEDLICTMRSTGVGPFPFPRKAEWPRCGGCGEQMAFIGSMDFRGHRSIGAAANVPDGSLVLHGCNRCTIPCSNENATSLTWITSDMSLELRAGTGHNSDAIEVGRAYETIEFLTPAFYAKDLSDDADFSKEWGIYHNFACPLNKVGGHLNWIQGEETPCDKNGNPMQFVGQFLGSRDVELGDSGIVFVFFSEKTRETKAVLQCY